MNVSRPLPLKISLWLLLNLLLLAAGLAAFVGVQGGVGWDSLVRGPAGNRAQELGRIVVGDYADASDPAAARRVLDRFGEIYGAGLFAVHPHIPGATDPLEELPERVGRKIDEGRAVRGGPPPGRGPPDLASPSLLPPGKGVPLAPPLEAEYRGRFLTRAGEPPVFWLGVRVHTARSPIPVTLVIRTDSWWGLMRLLNLQPWLLAGGGVVVFSILFWLPLVLGITRDLRRLTVATRQIAEGKFDARVDATRRDEIGQLGESVNVMAARLDTLVNGQKRFLGDIAHELGSPIGRLQIATEILDTRADPALRPHVAPVHREVQQIAALVNELLAFTKAGLRPRDAELAAVSLAPLVQEVLAREHAGDRVAVAVPTDLSVRADAALLTRALGNLVRNALRYTGPTDAIRLTARRDGAGVSVTIEDEGPGVAPEALARLGEPFYRPEVARSRETGGVGLGLAIVRSSVAACGGEVHFSNGAPRGFRVEVRLTAA